MMLFAVVLGLAALTAADPDAKEKIPQEPPIVHEEKQPVLPEQQVAAYNAIPFYKQVYNPFSSKIYNGYPRDRNFYDFIQKYESQKYGDYPYYPYKYFMTYPYKNNYYWKYLNKFQPKVYYDSKDAYDYVNPYEYQDFAYQPQLYAPGYNQPHYTQKYTADVDYVLPYSPSYYPQYAYKQEYPQFYAPGYNQPHYTQKYNADMDSPYVLPYSPSYYQQYAYKQEYPQVYSPSYYQHHYTQKYNADIDYPYVLPYSPSYYQQYAYKQGYPHFNKYYGKNLDLEHVKPWTTYGKQWDVDYIRNYAGRNLHDDIALPIGSTEDWEGKPLSHDVPSGVYYKPIISRNLDLDSVLPAVPIKDLDVDPVKPFALKYSRPHAIPPQ